MNPFNTLCKLGLLITAYFMVACSPQKKVQFYSSYLLKNKATSSGASTSQKAPVSTQSYTKTSPSSYNASSVSVPPKEKAQTSLAIRKVESFPEARIYKETDPIAKTEVKSSIDVPTNSSSNTSPKQVTTLPVHLGMFETHKVLQSANTYLGTPYQYAGMSQQGIDCSGLICKAYASVNITLPRNSQAMAASGKVVALEEVAPGNLLFFHSYKGKGVNHVAMVSKVGSGEIEFIHATVSEGVRKDKLSDPYWKQRYRMAMVPTQTK